MLQLSSCIRHGVWSCALGALIAGSGCGSFVVADATSQSAGSGSSSAGAGGAGGATTGVGSGAGTGGTGSTGSTGSSSGTGGAGGAAGVPLWSKAFNNAYPYSVAVDPFGNIVVAGYFHDTLDFGGATPLTSAGGRDAFVVKLDPSGKAIWGKSFGDADDQWVRSVAVDGAGNVIITGEYQGIIDLGGGPLVTKGPFKLGFLAKFDPLGKHLWSKSFGDTSGLEAFVAVDASGDVLLTGGFNTSIDLGGGPLQGSGINPSVFLAKLDPAGKHVWSKAFGDSVEVRAIAADKQGNPAITGTYYGPLDFGGGPLPSTGVKNAYLAQLDATGGYRGSKGFSSATDAEGTCIGVDGGGSFFVAGQFTGDIDLGAGKLTSATGGKDIFVARLALTGTFWSKRFGDIADDIPYGCAVSGPENVVLTGAFGATPNDPQKLGGVIDFGGGPLVNKGDADVFVAELDPLSKHRFSRSAGDIDQQFGTSVAVDNGPGDTIVAGYFKGTIDLGGTPLSSQDGMFLAKFGP